MKQILPLIFFIVLTFISTVSANWIPTGGPEGGNVQYLIRAKNNDLVMATYSGGIFKSVDNGSTWSSSNSGLNPATKNFTKISFLKLGLNGNLYLNAVFGNENRAFVSTDNGSTWKMLAEQVWGAGPTTATADGTLYQWLNNELAVSKNGGTSWDFPVLNGLPKEKISDLVPISNSELYIVFSDAKGIYKSTDAGANWAKITTQPISLLNCTLYNTGETLYILSGTTIQISTDQGKTWTYTYNPPTFPLEPNNLAVADNGDVYVTARIAGVLKSTDKGKTWSQFFTGLEIAGVNVAVATTKSNEVLVCQYGFGVFKSPQNSAGFILASSGFKGASVKDFFEGPTGNFYVIGDGTLFSSSDKGKSWKKLIDYALTYSSVCEKDNNIFLGKNDGVMRSSNGGTSWAYVKNGFTIGTQQYVHQLVVTSKGTILAATGGGMFRTTNNGDSWTKLAVFGTNTAIKTIIQKTNGDLYASSNYKMYKSVDDGVTWSLYPLGKMVNPDTNLDGAIDVINHISDSKNNLYINFGGNFYLKSADNGVTWTKQTIPAIGITSIKTILLGGNDSLFVVTNNNVLVSTDFGATHKEFNTGTINRQFNGLAKTSNGSIYLLTDGAGLMKRGTIATASGLIAKNEITNSITGCFPNPFSNSCVINYHVEKSGKVSLKIYSLNGAEVAVIVNEFQQEGNHKMEFNAESHGLKGGIYLCKLVQNGKTSVRKINYKRE